MISLQYHRRERNMPAQTAQPIASERIDSAMNGWLMLVLNIVLLLGASYLLNLAGAEGGAMRLIGGLCALLGLIMVGGYFTLQPNEARVLILFGAYKGTVRRAGFHWGNPFYANGQRQSFLVQLANAENKGGSKPSLQPTQRQVSSRNKMSLRARTLNMDRLKVNDKRGNPIEIAAVVVWRVQDTAQAAFDVDNYESYVQTQSETSLRHLASSYAYDHGQENEVTLRSGVDGISQALCAELQER